MDTCDTCAVQNGFYAVNAIPEKDTPRQVCLKGNGADPEVPTDNKIFLIIGSCVAGMLVIGGIIWCIVKSKRSENDDLYDSMISNGPI